VTRAFLNSAAIRDGSFRGAFTAEEYLQVETFYRSDAASRATPLRTLRGLAASLSIGELLVKDETRRFGLGAFKTTGVRFALSRLDVRTLSRGLVCATAGNHGRAVAHAARELGVRCTVFVPALAATAGAVELDTRTARVDAMRRDGAMVVEVSGAYEDAVRDAAAHGAATGATIVSDTSWPGYEQIPRAIMAGYTWLFFEASVQWEAAPDVVIVQGGVGGLICAAVSWFAWRFGGHRPFLIACEPDQAACLQASASAGRLVRLATHDETAKHDETSFPLGETMMAGLRCAEPSPAAWPTIRDGVDAFISIPDSIAIAAMQALEWPAPTAGADPVIHAGPSGACGAGALMALAHDPALGPVREACGFSQSTRAMVIVTEGK
jgi:diaminopropionate ammonia-lyase